MSTSRDDKVDETAGKQPEAVADDMPKQSQPEAGPLPFMFVGQLPPSVPASAHQPPHGHYPHPGFPPQQAPPPPPPPPPPPKFTGTRQIPLYPSIWPSTEFIRVMQRAR